MRCSVRVRTLRTAIFSSRFNVLMCATAEVHSLNEHASGAPDAELPTSCIEKICRLQEWHSRKRWAAKCLQLSDPGLVSVNCSPMPSKSLTVDTAAALHQPASHGGRYFAAPSTVSEIAWVTDGANNSFSLSLNATCPSSCPRSVSFSDRIQPVHIFRQRLDNRVSSPIIMRHAHI